MCSYEWHRPDPWRSYTNGGDSMATVLRWSTTDRNRWSGWRRLLRTFRPRSRTVAMAAGRRSALAGGMTKRLSRALRRVPAEPGKERTMTNLLIDLMLVLWMLLFGGWRYCRRDGRPRPCAPEPQDRVISISPARRAPAARRLAWCRWRTMTIAAPRLTHLPPFPSFMGPRAGAAPARSVHQRHGERKSEPMCGRYVIEDIRSSASGSSRWSVTSTEPN